MLVDEIKKRASAAMRSGKTVEKEILRVALGEIQTAEARGVIKSDEDALAIVRKLVKSNEETLAMTADAAKKQTLEEELTILRTLLPQSLSVAQIVALLEPVRADVRAAGNDGQATGVAMKKLKAEGAVVAGKDVAEAVRQLRA